MERLILGTFGICFGGIGIAVLAFIWSKPSGFPPLFFRVFISFIAIPFVAFGVAALRAAVTGKAFGSGLAKLRDRLPATGSARDEPSRQQANRATFVCPHCAAPVGDGAEISPSGDVKCPYCRAWFNVRGA